MGNRGSRQNESELGQFRLLGVKDTGRTLGQGAYAVVKELEYQGRKCAGKRIHALLFESASVQEKEEMLRRFTSECRLLGRLTHPCLVQFLGVHWERGSRLPFLVMEFLPYTLSDYIGTHGASLGESERYSILRDVAQGLRYLHGLDVVHRDLSANNVLLTMDMKAKISDLGVAKIINISPEQMTRHTSTQAPGTTCYMPPEALVAKPHYTSKLDIYSYGVLMIHVLCGRWPFPSDPFQPNPDDPDSMVPVQEVDRRAEYLQQIGKSHPLMGLIRCCLHNNPSKRPKAAELLEQVSPLVPTSAADQTQGGSDTNMAGLTEKVERLTTAESKSTAAAVSPKDSASATEILNVDSIIQRLLEGSRPGMNVHLTEAEIRGLCLKSREIFLVQPVLLELEAPMKICGNIHGQFYDLLRLFEYTGFPPESNYLFLGNYVDYGKQSLETICLLLAYKIKYPENFFLLRGNHECASINRKHGFYDECKRRYNIRLWKAFTHCFNCLPVAAIVDEKIFCVNGGLSPDLQSMEQIYKITRPTGVPDQGLLCDLLWADPDKETLGWGENDRGISFTFGPEIVSKFLAKHDMNLIVRSHQVVEDGYEFFANRQLVTLFSAPNYRGEFDNAAAVMSLDETLMASFQILKPAVDRRKIYPFGSSKSQGLN